MGQVGTHTAIVIFTDLVGSTELRTRLGDVAADRLRRIHDQTQRAVIERAGGTVVKSLGDGLLATFGAAAACTAAEELQQAADRANRTADESHRLGLRVGLSAGDVSWEDGDCHGTPVVTAARLCDRAGAGRILADDLVRGLARGRSEHQFSLVGELDLKGLGEPVLAYEVVWTPTRDQVAPLPSALEPVPGELPFAGRDAERDRMLMMWESATTTGRAVALVSGEPGVGKTRLTSEVARIVHEQGAWVLVGRCDETITAAFAPWIEILRQVVASGPEELLVGHVERRGGEIIRLVPELALRVADVPAPRVLDPESERLALFDAVLDLVADATREAPVLLVLDDAHWADTASLHLLAHAVRRTPSDARLLVVVTYRDTDVDRSHPLAAVIADLRREPRVERLALRGIDEEGMRALLTAAGGAELEAEGLAFARTLVHETEGNPFFVGEVIRHLVESGVLVRRDGRWQGSVSLEDVGIPEGVRDVVGRRLSRLPAPANEVLRTAAVIGRDFDLDLVTSVTGISEPETVEHLEAALRARLVHEAGVVGSFSFSHALVRQTLLEELSTTRRVRLHRTIGEALETRGDASAAELAYHFAEAATTGVADRAVAYARAAAEDASTRLANDEAVRFMGMALESAEVAGSGPGERGELLARRAEFRHRAVDPDNARVDALAAADLARRAGDARLLAHAGLAYQGEGALGMWAAPADPVAVGLIREGLAGIDPADVAARARATAGLAMAVILEPGDESLTLAQEADRLATVAGDVEAMNRARFAWAWAMRGRSRPDEMEAVARRALEAAALTPERLWELTAPYFLGIAFVGQGRLDDAMVQYRAGAELGAMRGWAPTVFEASLAACRGRWDDAVAGADRAHDLGRAIGDTNDAVWCGQRARIEWHRGRLEDALVWVERGEQTALGLAVSVRAVVLGDLGDVAAAAHAARRWERDVYPLVPAVVGDFCLWLRALHLPLTHDPAAARAVLEDLGAVSARLLGSETSILGAPGHLVGVAAAALEAWDDAVRAFETARAVHAQLELPVYEARSALALGQALLARDGPGDAERAGAALGEARAQAGRLGMALVAEQARTAAP